VIADVSGEHFIDIEKEALAMMKRERPTWSSVLHPRRYR
jgi:hypothetical protein